MPIREPSADDRPTYKLLYCVLLMAARDGASAVRFEPGDQTLDLSYLCDGTWYGLVPAPAHVWPVLRDKVMGEADHMHAVPFERPPSRGGWLARRLGGGAAQAGELTGGTLIHAFAGCERRWGFLLDTRPGRVALLLTTLHQSEAIPDITFPRGGVCDEIMFDGAA